MEFEWKVAKKIKNLRYGKYERYESLSRDYKTGKPLCHLARRAMFTHR